LSEPLREQYATDDNLQARIALHARFATNPHWAEWLFEREQGGPGARILDVGCGPAVLWRANLDRIDPSWTLTLTDFSPGMLEAARRAVGDRAEYHVADAQALPFADDSFDVVVANHMLYHVPDRPAAFREIRRVLGPGGAFHASTIGRAHMGELAALVPGWMFGRHAEAFGLETGPPQLEPFFGDVRVESFPSELAVTEAEPALAYVRSTRPGRAADLAGARAAIEAAIARDGAFRITTSSGVIGCRNH
jgi:ubiquinone/menaquinone biosynthesis C-methylase UbiE